MKHACTAGFPACKVKATGWKSGGISIFASVSSELEYSEHVDNLSRPGREHDFARFRTKNIKHMKILLAHTTMQKNRQQKATKKPKKWFINWGLSSKM